MFTKYVNTDGYHLQNTYNMKKKFLILCIISFCVHIFFYFSAFFTHILDIFFEHVTTGQDFFQIPNAVYSFLHGGTLTGSLPYNIPAYTTCCGVNSNVYHPLFTLLIGYPLQLFQPAVAIDIWVGVHALVTFALCIFVCKKFLHNQKMYLGISFFLLNSYHYYEIQHAQYHFLLVVFTFLFLYEILTSGDTKKAGLWFFLSLLVKPIGLLWIIPLLLHKHYKTVVFGIGMYLVCSLPFIILPWGRYYFLNILAVSHATIPTYNLFALTTLFPISGVFIKTASYLCAFILIIFQIWKKPPLFFIIFQWITYQLLFYPLVFHYHYTIVATFILIGFLFSYFSVKKIEIIPIIFLTIPTPILFFHLAGDPAILPTQHLSLMALWSIGWVLFLTLCTMFTKTISLKRQKHRQ